MKIGLIGNMNNNNFALMRYFRDLGADAHLLLYKNDGQGTLSHFTPEADTWEIEKWAPYIHQTEIPNAPIAALDFPLSWLMSIRSWVRFKQRKQDIWVASVSRRCIELTYSGYDKLIASGISPATLGRVNRGLDIFYPYSPKVEFLFSGWFTRLKSSDKVNIKIFNKIQNRQAAGIQLAANVINFEAGVTQDALLSLDVTPRLLGIPMVYSGELLPKAVNNCHLTNAAQLITTSSFSILHHARVMWRNNGSYTDEAWQLESKNTHWLIHSFAKFIANRPGSNPRLFLVEYGPDVTATKELALSLGIASYVTWLPKVERRELMWLLSRVSAVVGEFWMIPRMPWGGTGWEALAYGKPLLQGFNFKDGEFENIFGHLPPPILAVRTERDILKILLDIYDSKIDLDKIGQDARLWFNQYNGIGMAKKWLHLISN
jgi:hypothetical protein